MKAGAYALFTFLVPIVVAALLFAMMWCLFEPPSTGNFLAIGAIAAALATVVRALTAFLGSAGAKN